MTRNRKSPLFFTWANVCSVSEVVRGSIDTGDSFLEMPCTQAGQQSAEGGGGARCHEVIVNMKNMMASKHAGVMYNDEEG